MRDRLRRLAALTGLRRPGSWVAMRSWLPVSEIALVATERRSQRSAACTSAILLAEVPCDTAVMARTRKSPARNAAAPDALDDDLYDYARASVALADGRRKIRPRGP